MAEGSGSAAAATDDDDQISELPDEIIHNILYRIKSPTTAAQTSALSRRWLHLWRTYPVLEFSDSDFQNDSRAAKFSSFAAASSRRLLPQIQQQSPLILEVVRIWFGNCRRPQLDSWGKTWEKYGLANLSPIEIVIDGRPNSERPVISLDFSRTRVLTLSGLFNLDALKTCSTNNVASMEHLQVLNLHFVRIGSEKALNIFTSLCNAPNLTTLTLSLAYALKTRLEIVSKKSLVIQSFNQPLDIHIISAPLLHTLKFNVPDPLVNKLSLESSSSSAPNLKVLAVQFHRFNSSFTQSHLDHLLCNFPSIRSLSLTICDVVDQLGMQRQNCLRISSTSLRELSFTQWHNRWLGLHIDAPNLVTLRHSKLHAGLPVNNNAVHLANVASSCQYVFGLSTICIKHGDNLSIDYRWFVELREFLATLTRSQPRLSLVLKLDKLNNLQQVTFDSGQATADYNGVLPSLVAQRLELGTDVMKTFDVKKGGDAFLDGLFWICRPNFLSVRHDYEPLFSYICGQLLKRDDVTSCCSDFKCWRHQLKSVKIKSESDDHMIEIFRDVVSSIMKTQKANFMLTWY